MSERLRIIADENIPALAELLAGIADITCLPGRTMTAPDLRDADALLVRSVTQVNAALLKESGLRFVGTCTIGTDHVDTGYLASHGIAFASAPGCNAAAVVDYVIAAMLAVYPLFPVLQGKVVGIVGYGQVGSRLHQRLQRMGIACKLCDPFREEATAGLDEILACDIISLHVPYTRQGEHATHHLLGKMQLEKIRPGSLLINSSRGAVVDNAALTVLLQQHRFHAVLDVYEDEPAPDITLLELLDIATAHIAGYSLHGKIRGTMQVADALLKTFQVNSPVVDLLEPLVHNMPVTAGENMASLAGKAYDIREDSRRFVEIMHKTADKAEQARQFDLYRKNYPVRYEWSYIRIDSSADVKDMARMLGIGEK